MGFELGQPHSHLESVNEFKERTVDMLMEAKVALLKSKDEMAEYYDWRWTPTPDYQPGDKVYLDASNIHTTSFPTKDLDPSVLSGKSETGHTNSASHLQ